MQYQYEALRLNADSEEDPLEELNKMGDRGWRVVEVYRPVGGITYLMMREKPIHNLFERQSRLGEKR